MTVDTSETAAAALFGANPDAGGAIATNTNTAFPRVAYDSRFCNKNWGANLTPDWKLRPDLAVKSTTGYCEFNALWTEDNGVSPMDGSLGAEHLLNHTTTLAPHQILDYVIPGLDFEFLGNDPVQETDYGAFGNGTWHIVEVPDLNGGARHTHQNKTSTYNRYNPPTV